MGSKKKPGKKSIKASKIQNKEIEFGELERIEQKEEAIEKQTHNLEKLENEIKEEIEQKPLTSFSLNDLNKGIVGAFIGVVAHFAFVYGEEVAKRITTVRASLLLVFSYMLIIILMYETGYRQISEKRLLFVLPRRATIIYLTSIFMVIVIFALFNMLDFSKPLDLYKQIAVTSVLASLGAGTADLIGKN